jgi:hypothetical protein
LLLSQGAQSCVAAQDLQAAGSYMLYGFLVVYNGKEMHLRYRNGPMSNSPRWGMDVLEESRPVALRMSFLDLPDCFLIKFMLHIFPEFSM